MLFRQLFDKISSTYTYLIASDYAGNGIFIDPVIDCFSLYQRLISEYNLTLIASLETHLHADHITASGKLCEEYACDIIMGNTTKVRSTIRRIKDGEYLTFDNISIQAIHTPGHTEDSFCYYMQDRIFTGDSLLIRGTGRTDFQQGNSRTAYDSLFNKILTLPDDTMIYPGHDYNGMTMSTITEEKQFNPRLQVQNADEYVDIMDHLNLGLPEKMEIAIPANLVCGLTASNTRNTAR